LDGDDFDGNGVPDTGVSGTPILNWVDKAPGQGVNTVSVTAGTPTIDFGVVGTHNAVHFTGGSPDKLDNTAFTVGSDYTVFTVVQADVSAAGIHVLSGINNDATDSVLYRAGNAFRFYSGVTTGNVDSGISPVRLPPTTYKLVGYQINSTGSDLGLFQSLPTSFEGNGTAQLNGIRIGNLDRATPSNVTQAEAWNGHIAEVVIYDRKLTPTEVANVGQYLSTKYSLGASFATGAMTQTETGHVSGGTPSTLNADTEPVVSGRVNAALSSNGGVAFAKDFIAGARDFRPFRLNDGFYSDPASGPAAEEPWLAGTLDSFAGVKLNLAMTIDRIGFEDEFGSRRNGAFIFEYTRDNLSGVPTDPNLGLDPTAIAAKNWQLLDVQQIQDAADTRHLYSFAPVTGVTGVRIRIESSLAEVGISELEVWAIPEPATAGLAVLGGFGLLLQRRRRA
jgi:hypothetical protein